MRWFRTWVAKQANNRRMDDLEEEIKAVRKAYGRLEHDSEEMWETVRKALGRVSRLKRDTDSGKLETAAAAGPSPTVAQPLPSEQRLAIYRSARAFSSHTSGDSRH